MSRYMDADALGIGKCNPDIMQNKAHAEGWNLLLDIINNAPTADVAPVVHGEWLTWEEKFPGKTPTRKNNLGVFCIVCGNHADNRHDFCPNCGADMRKAVE